MNKNFIRLDYSEEIYNKNFSKFNKKNIIKLVIFVTIFAITILTFMNFNSLKNFFGITDPTTLVIIGSIWCIIILIFPFIFYSFLRTFAKVSSISSSKKFYKDKFQCTNYVIYNNQLYKIYNENKIDIDTDIKYIIENPSANPDFIITKYLNFYKIKEYTERYEIICDYIDLNDNKLNEKYETTIHKAFLNLDKLIEFINNKMDEPKMDLTDYKKNENGIRKNKLLTFSMYFSSILSFIIILVSSLFNSFNIWTYFLSNFFLMISMVISLKKEIIIADTRNFVVGICLNIILTILYYKILFT